MKKLCEDDFEGKSQLSLPRLQALAKPKRGWLMVLNKFFVAPTFPRQCAESSDMAAISHDSQTKTVNDGLLSGRVLCTLLRRSRVASCRTSRSLL